MRGRNFRVVQDGGPLRDSRGAWGAALLLLPLASAACTLARERNKMQDGASWAWPGGISLTWRMEAIAPGSRGGLTCCLVSFLFPALPLHVRDASICKSGTGLGAAAATAPHTSAATRFLTDARQSPMAYYRRSPGCRLPVGDRSDGGRALARCCIIGCMHAGVGTAVASRCWRHLSCT